MFIVYSHANCYSNNVNMFIVYSNKYASNSFEVEFHFLKRKECNGEDVCLCTCKKVRITKSSFSKVFLITPKSTFSKVF